MLAHLVQTGFGGFYDGIAHWALSPRDVLVTLALALIGGLGGPRIARPIVLAISAAWLIGGLIGFQLPALGEMPLATTLTLGICSLLAALDRIPPPAAAALLATVCGGIHGIANGSLMLAEDRAPLTLAGTVTAVAFVILLAAAALATVKNQTARLAIRVAGSWLAAIALLLLGWLFRPSS